MIEGERGWTEWMNGGVIDNGMEERNRNVRDRRMKERDRMMERN